MPLIKGCPKSVPPPELDGSLFFPVSHSEGFEYSKYCYGGIVALESNV